MSSNDLAVRDLYKTISRTKTHLVQSKEIATTCVCPYLFKMSYPFGVVGGERDYLVANTVHDIISLASPTTILDNWRQGKTESDFEYIAKSIDNDSQSIVEKAIINAKEKARMEGKTPVLDTFDYEVQDRFHGLLIGLAKRIMRKYERPKRAVTEITITNVKEAQEGRIDAIFEFGDGKYGLIDWKTNDIEKAQSSGMDKWQLVTNLLLANYRYTGDENNWSKYLFSSVVFYQGAYIPRSPLSEDWINKVKIERKFAYETLCGGRPHAQKPAFCPICDRDGESSFDCRFYREDSKQALQGNLPVAYANIRRLLLKRRYLVLDERAETHKHKFVINSIIEKLGETAAMQELQRTGVIHCGYRVQSINANSVTLVKESNNNNDGDDLASLILLEPRKIVRLIGKEDGDGIPLLACINEKGFVKEVDDTKVVVDFDTNTIAQRVQIQLTNLPIIIIPDEINLTRRVLEPMHRFHRLAADIMLPMGFFGNNRYEPFS
ncbi:MAG: hypothetical protein ACJ72J_09460 [Nitrososphaeraceae archaeon]